MKVISSVVNNTVVTQVSSDQYKKHINVHLIPMQIFCPVKVKPNFNFGFGRAKVLTDPFCNTCAYLFRYLTAK